MMVNFLPVRRPHRTPLVLFESTVDTVDEKYDTKLYVNISVDNQDADTVTNSQVCTRETRTDLYKSSQLACFYVVHALFWDAYEPLCQIW